MIRQISPMLAKGVEGYWLKKRIRDRNWVGEVKYDGSRYICHFENDRNYFTSRRVSEKDGLLCEKGLNLPHLNKRVEFLHKTVLDGEVMAGKTSSDTTSVMGGLPDHAVGVQERIGYAKYYVFDILYYKGIDVRNKSLRDRREMLERAVKVWDNQYVSVVEWHTDKQKLYEDVVASGGEGIIIKNLDSKYVDGSRSKDAWIKWKKAETFDVVITGFSKPEKYTVTVEGVRTFNRFFARGWISAIKFGVYKNDRLIEIGQTSGMSDLVRSGISRSKEKYIGKVIEVEGQELTKYGVIRHPRFIRFRDDKNPLDCTLKALKALAE